MTDDVLGSNPGVVLYQLPAAPSQHLVLPIRIGLLIASLQLDTNTEIIAIVAAPIMGCACVPGTVIKTDILGDDAAAIN